MFKNYSPYKYVKIDNLKKKRMLAVRSRESIPGYLTIIPRARVGYEVIDSQRGA